MDSVGHREGLFNLRSEGVPMVLRSAYVGLRRDGVVFRVGLCRSEDGMCRSESSGDLRRGPSSPPPPPEPPPEVLPVVLREGLCRYK